MLVGGQLAERGGVGWRRCSERRFGGFGPSGPWRGRGEERLFPGSVGQVERGGFVEGLFGKEALLQGGRLGGLEGLGEVVGVVGDVEAVGIVGGVDIAAGDS